jgi:hypothetical protein
MGLFANRWRTLREAAPDGVASLHVQTPEPQEVEPVRRRRVGKLRQPIELQQDELRA